MLGSRDYPMIINEKLNQIFSGRKKKAELDFHNIRVEEAIQCTRLSYFDRMEPIEDITPQIINNLVREGFLNLMKSTEAKYKIEDLTLVVTPDLVLDGELIANFHLVSILPDSVSPRDMLFANACLFALDKELAIVVYITPEGTHTQFFVGKSNRMFEQVVRRARILSMLLEERKKPVIEPSPFCVGCKYNDRCFPQQKDKSPQLLEDLFGTNK
jgi:CRISPR-associated exonuclease Cas4